VHALAAAPLLRELVLALFSSQHGPATQEAIVALLLRTLPEIPDLPTVLPMPTSPLLLRATTALLQGEGWNWPLERVAEHAAMAPRTFTRHFGAEVGLTFRMWRRRARVLTSLDLLASGQPVKAIARRLRFASDAAYVAAFREVIGTPPESFRRKLDTHSRAAPADA
jgi:AraC-like DNA-binding protein